jgi:hypothetical protein
MSWFEPRIRSPRQPLTDRWKRVPVEPRGVTRIGFSFRTPQVEAFGLEGHSALRALLEYPFQVVRLGAYWNRIEARPGLFFTDELDWQFDTVERAGKEIILSVGALKTFGYPEFFVPRHRLEAPLPEGKLIRPEEHASLHAAALEFVERIVERYRDRTGLFAWQVEHEAVDPLGFEHSWRLSTSFVEQEVGAVRNLDPSRPIVMNAYLPASMLAAVTQWFRTRDQGDSLAFAEHHADIVGLDYYPRHALIGLGPRTLYLEGGGAWLERTRSRLLAQNRRVMVTEAQAEPWEAVTLPPRLSGSVAYSCPPEQIIATYNDWMHAATAASTALEAFLFWGAEYWLVRQLSGDVSYLGAVERILEGS